MIIFLCVNEKINSLILICIALSLSTCVEQSFAPNWSTCYNIIKGICKGLNSLHEHDPQILHLDLKPANILLDSCMEPKLADFGLSRLFTQSNTHVIERVVGTRKYMPPEFIKEKMISPKNDVFSLGVVIIDIMKGPTGYSTSFEMDDVTQLKQQVLTKWNTMIEATSKYISKELHQVKTCIELAMHCVDFERNNRPSIAGILYTLNKTEPGIPNKQVLSGYLMQTDVHRRALSATDVEPPDDVNILVRKSINEMIEWLKEAPVAVGDREPQPRIIPILWNSHNPKEEEDLAVRLAQEVYQHPSLVASFDCKAWIRVGRSCNLHHILQEILVKVEPLPIPDGEENTVRTDTEQSSETTVGDEAMELAKKPLDYLKGKRILFLTMCQRDYHGITYDLLYLIVAMIALLVAL